MPWCPRCRVEYGEKETRCSDCQSELVDELKEEKREEYDTEEFLITVKNEIEFSIIKSKLGQLEISVMKKHKAMGGYLNVYMGATPFGVDIYVPSKQLNLAKQIIQTSDNSGEIEEQGYVEELEENADLTELEKSINRRRGWGAWIIILLFAQGFIWIIIELIKGLIEKLQ